MIENVDLVEQNMELEQQLNTHHGDLDNLFENFNCNRMRKKTKPKKNACVDKHEPNKVRDSCLNSAGQKNDCAKKVKGKEKKLRQSKKLVLLT